MKLEDIAKVCYESNKAYCETLGDFSQMNWEQAQQWQKVSVINGVKNHLTENVTPEQSHENWVKHKLEEGWIYGEERNAELKTHPCIIPFDELSVNQQRKDKLFSAVVNALRD